MTTSIRQYLPPGKPSHFQWARSVNGLVLLAGALWLAGCQQTPAVPPSASEAAALAATDSASHAHTPPASGADLATTPRVAESMPASEDAQRPQWLQQCTGAGQLDRPPSMRRSPLPKASNEMRVDPAHSTVTVVFRVSEHGKVDQMLVRPGADPRLAKLATRAIRQWKFSKMTRDGVPTGVCFEQSFDFRFSD